MADKKGRINEIIKRNLSEIIIYDLKNELTHYASITEITLTSDYSYCKVYVNHLDSSKNENLVNFLNKRKGKIRTMLANKISIYKTPELSFYIDENLNYFNKMNKLIEEVNNKKMYTLSDYKKEQEKKNSLTEDKLLKDIKKLSTEESDNELVSYHLKDTDLQELVEEYSLLDTKLLTLDKVYEINTLYFAISLKKLKDISSQVDFILKNKEHLLDSTMTSFIAKYFNISSLKEDILSLVTLSISSLLTRCLFFSILKRYKDKNDVDRILSYVKDYDEEELDLVISSLLTKLYFTDKDKVLNFISNNRDLKVSKMSKDELLSSTALKENEKKRIRNILED